VEDTEPTGAGPSGREIVLHGGRANAGNVVRIGDEVARPAHPQTPFVEHFLHHLRAKGLEIVPEPLGTDERARQRLSFIEGAAPTSPYPEWAFDHELLIDVATQQRRLHIAARDYVPPRDARWAVTAGDYFPPGSAGALFCHNDLCMSNVIVDVDRRRVCGFVDFDYVAPVDRRFDIAVLARHWVPFGDPDGAELTEIDRVPRFAAIAEVHELDHDTRHAVLDLSIDFLEHARRNVRSLADGGNEGFRRMIEAGYESTNLATVQWVHDHRREMVDRT